MFIVNLVENYVKDLEKIYPKLNNVQKALAMKHLLHSIHNFHPIIEVINQDYNIKKGKKRFDNVMKKAYDILRKEPRDYIDGRPVLRRLLHLVASRPMVNMNKFLEEIK